MDKNLNLLKQFTLGQRRAKAFASEFGCLVNDATTIELIATLKKADWSQYETQDTFSFLILITAYRYYAFADRLLNQCQKPEMADTYQIQNVFSYLDDLANTLSFYQSVQITNVIPENALPSVQDTTNILFGFLAVNFPQQLKELEAHWAAVLPRLQHHAMPEGFYEPTFSATHEQFMGAVDKTQCIFAPTGKYWGADEWRNDEPFEANIERFAKGFYRFMTLAKKEKFKGFALRFPAQYSSTLEKLQQTVAKFLNALNQIDPAKSNCMQKNISHEGWKYSWSGETLFLTAFGTCYPLKHPRNPYGFDYTYFFFQPDFVLRNHPGLTDGREQQSRDRILSNFRRNGMEYNNEGKGKEVERYIRPMQARDPAVRWWESL